MRECGTNIVAGITPGRGGETVEGVPIFDCVRESVGKCGANASVMFVPAPMMKDAALESIEAGLKLVVAVPEHVPVHDTIFVRRSARENGIVLLGPNTPGIISPGIGKMGIMPSHLFQAGRIGLISRSGTLAYEVAGHINESGFGESTLVGIGGDPVTGMSLEEILRDFEADYDTDAVVVIGEIGGCAEEDAASYIKSMSKPVIAYIAGRSAPRERRMGHAGAIIREGEGGADSKLEVLDAAGAKIARNIADIPRILRMLQN
jgi:succinyl-CoA synthetase alpha subunit